MKGIEFLKILKLLLPVLIGGLIGYFGVGLLTGAAPGLEWLQFLGAVALALGAWYFFIVRKVEGK